MADCNEYSLRNSVDLLAREFQLTDEERRDMLPSGQTATFDSRVSWARTYMKKAGLIEATKRGYVQITQRGHEVLKQNPKKITAEFLWQYEEFREFKGIRGVDAVGEVFEPDCSQNPDELLERSYGQINKELANELLTIVKSSDPKFFEQLVVDLLVIMGYGGSVSDAGKAIGKSGDEGIDGL